MPANAIINTIHRFWVLENTEYAVEGIGLGAEGSLSIAVSTSAISPRPKGFLGISLERFWIHPTPRYKNMKKIVSG
jgi:hypothetical protein